MRILLFDESASSRLFLCQQVGGLGYHVETVTTSLEGVQRATANQYDLCLCVLPTWQGEGHKILEVIAVICPTLPVVILTAGKDLALLQGRVEKAGYDNVLAILPNTVECETLAGIMATVKVQTHESVNKLARIVCTIGPACNTPEIIGKMIIAGMDVARLNFSHGSYDDHLQSLQAVRAAEEEWGRPVAILVDLCGPKIRTGPMANGGVQLKAGARIVIQAEAIEGTAERISTIAPDILPDLRPGDPILIDDGMLELKVERAGRSEVLCQVVVGGELKSSKGINLPATPLSLPSLTAKDRADLEWAMDHSVDFVALSFVRQARDIVELKAIIAQAGKRKLQVVAKIEKPEAVENIGEIIEAADVIMIARGDLGVELPAVRVPHIQQRIIEMCWTRNTPVITATQMLDTMTRNFRPTRAEVTDVSVAIKEGTDAVMLSGETATGIDPVNVVRTMARIISEEEKYTKLSIDRCELLSGKSEINPALTAAATFSDSAAVLVIDFGRGIYRHMSKWNRSTPTLLATNSLHAARHSCVFKNIVPIITKENFSRDEVVFWAIREAKLRGYLRDGDVLAVVEGERQTQGGLSQVGAFQLVRVEAAGAE